MTVTFDWREEYAVGNEELDSQHKQLFNMGNEIQKVEDDKVKTYVMKLYKYTREHFHLEEEHMKTMLFPDLEHHRLLHDKLLSDLNTIAEKFDRKSDALEKFRSFLFTWLTDHILQQDKKYFEFSRRKK